MGLDFGNSADVSVIKVGSSGYERVGVFRSEKLTLLVSADTKNVKVILKMKVP